MATVADYNLLRQEVGASETQIGDALAEMFFDESSALYPSNADAAHAYARVKALRILVGQASSQADYVQNEESERLSQIAAAKEKLLAYWEEKLAEAVAAARVPEGARPFAFSLGKATAKRWYP